MSLRSAVKSIIPKQLFDSIEPYGHLGEAVVAQIITGFPARKLKVIGVTGTDGKTSTTTLITQMLRNSGYKVAMMTTISVDYGDGKGEQPNPTRLTTLSAMSLARTIKRVKESGAEWLVLETTSHALAQHRVWGVPYSVAVMTNISHEHLDYHGTYEKYREAKRQLFVRCDRNHRGLRMGVYNSDDPSGLLFKRSIKNSIGYGLQKGKLRADDVKLTSTGSRYLAKIDGDEYQIACHLPGSFNVSNSLAAVGVGRAVGLSKTDIEDGIASLEAVEGRMTSVDEGQSFSLIVDYAHTPESFEKIIDEVKPVTKGKLIIAFGSAGRRDEAKRAKQGAIAGKHADMVIVTEEDDRDCDGLEILEQIAEGARKAGKEDGKDLFLIHKREAAIEKAVSIAKAGDTVLLLGKGHEKSILTNGPGGVGTQMKRPYDEVKVAKKMLQRR